MWAWYNINSELQMLATNLVQLESSVSLHFKRSQILLATYICVMSSRFLNIPLVPTKSCQIRQHLYHSPDLFRAADSHLDVSLLWGSLRWWQARLELDFLKSSRCAKNKARSIRKRKFKNCPFLLAEIHQNKISLQKLPPFKMKILVLSNILLQAIVQVKKISPKHENLMNSS